MIIKELAEMAEKNTEALSISIDSDVFKQFQNQWKERAQVKNKAGEAAIRIWISLPTEIQAKVLELKDIDGYDFLIKNTIEAEVSSFFKTMTQEEKKYFMDMALSIMKKRTAAKSKEK